jgi:hypothetical protein
MGARWSLVTLTAAVCVSVCGLALSPPVALAAAPVVDGEGVSGVTPFGAVLEGQVNPQGEETTYRFEYSTQESAGELQGATGVGFGGMPAGVSGDQPITVSLAGLVSATRYYYRVLARDAAGETKGKLEEFQTLPAEKPVVEDAHFIAATPTSDTLEAQLNPMYQGVSCEVQYVTEADFKASAFTEDVSSTGCSTAGGFGQGDSPVAFTATLGELQEGTGYEYRIIASNGSGTLETAPQLLARTVPQVLETLPGPEVSAVTRHTALVTPTLDPEVQAPIAASYYVIYGTEPASVEASVHQDAGSGLVAQTVAPIALTGLLAGTTYHYAVILSNGNAAVVGPERQFTTLPAETPVGVPLIGGESARYVNEDSAVIEGEVDPQGQAVSYQVQYGPSSSYGSSSPASPAQLAPFTSSQGVFRDLAGLVPGTTYHYRIVASNAAGISSGPDETFTTSGVSQTAVFTPFVVPSVSQFSVAPYAFPAQEAGGTPGAAKTTRAHKTGQACPRGKTKRARQCKEKTRKPGKQRKNAKTGGKKG